MICQLRIYTIQEGKMDEWIKGWREGVVPLRRKHGFRVGGAWVARERNTFVWILAYDGPGDWKVRNDAYYASTERRTLDPDPARLIVRAEEMFLSPLSSE